MKSVVSGLSSARVLAMWVPSMLDTNQTRGPPLEYGFRASVTIRGPWIEATRFYPHCKHTHTKRCRRCIEVILPSQSHQSRYWQHQWLPFQCSLSIHRYGLAVRKTKNIAMTTLHLKLVILTLKMLVSGTAAESLWRQVSSLHTKLPS